jgi:hypothetical protein
MCRTALVVVVLVSTIGVETAEITPADFKPTPFHDVDSLLPAAFADVDGDRFTDIVLLTADRRRLVTLLGQRDDPVVVPGPPVECELGEKERIYSVVPGDFDGDETVDILVTTLGAKEHPEDKDERSGLSLLRMFWGLGDGKFLCPEIRGQERKDLIFFDVSTLFSSGGCNVVPESVPLFSLGPHRRQCKIRARVLVGPRFGISSI